MVQSSVCPFIFNLFLVAAAMAVLLLLFPWSADAALMVGFYNTSCPNAEQLVTSAVTDIVRSDPSQAPALVRMQFHDCFVQGCDGSIMLQSRNGTGERDAVSSRYLRGYAAIDQIKAKLEQYCPLTVSCADIIVMATRDAIFLSKGPWYAVETGRRDGNISIAVDADNDIPPPTSSLIDLKTYFSVKDLDAKDILVLSGTHTIGVAHCASFADRLYNFTGLGDEDPSLSPAYADQLRQRCSPTDNATAVNLDPGNPFTFNLGYYKAVYNNQGLFTTDVGLLTDSKMRAYVEKMANATSTAEFFSDYVAAIVKLGRVNVLTDGNGVIRANCSAYVD